MRALEFQEKCKEDGTKKFTMEFLPTKQKTEYEWLDVWFGFIKDPRKKDKFIALKQLRDMLGDDNMDFEATKEA